MADNTTLDAGSGGDDIAADDIGGVKYQRVKIVEGADGVNDGDISSANPLPVTANLSATDNAVLDTIDAVLDLINAKLVTGTVIGDVNLGATDNAVLDTIAASLALLDNAIATGNEIHVDIIADQAGLATNAAQLADGHSVALSATDNAVLDTIDAVLDLINAKLVTGTVIGDVNLGAVDNAVLDAIVAAQLPDGHNVTVDNASLSVDLGANNDVTVTSGAVTATLSATDNAVLDTIDAVLDLINAKLVTGTVIGDVNLGATDNAVLDVIAAAVGVSTSAVGTTTFYDSDLDETKIEVTDNATSVIYSINAFNTTAAPLFLQLWDLDADSVTVGTTAPTNQYVIPGNADSDGAGFVINFGFPKKYSTGFTVACTTDSEGMAAPGAGACIVNIEYVT